MREKNRIWVLAPEFPPDAGGIATLTERLVENISDNEVTVFTGGISPAKEVKNNITIKRSISFSFRLFRYAFFYFYQPRLVRHSSCFILFNLLSLLKRAKRERPNHIFCNDIGTAVLAQKLSKIIKCNYSIFIHGNTYLNTLPNVKCKNYFLPALKGAKTVWVNSNFIKDIVDKEASVCAKVMPLGAATDIDIEEDKVTAPHPKTDIIKLLSVCRLVKRKNIDLVLEALKKIKLPNYSYTIIGSGPEKEYLENRVKQLKLEKQVVFCGYVSDEELKQHYYDNDIFIMPSKMIPPDDVEGFGIVFLEANQMGCAVIGGNSGGIPDAVEHGVNGLLVDPNSVEELVNAIETLAGNSELRKKMVVNGRDRIRRTYNWANAARILIENI